MWVWQRKEWRRKESEMGEVRPTWSERVSAFYANSLNSVHPPLSSPFVFLSNTAIYVQLYFYLSLAEQPTWHAILLFYFGTWLLYPNVPQHIGIHFFWALIYSQTWQCHERKKIISILHLKIQGASYREREREKLAGNRERHLALWATGSHVEK